MKILFVCNEYPPLKGGGIGVFVKGLAEELAKRNVDVYVHCMHSSYQESCWQEMNGVLVYRFPKKCYRFKRAENLLSRLEQSISLRKIVRKYNVNIVETYEWIGPIIFKPGVELVVRLHGGNYSYAQSEGKESSIFLQVLEKRTIRLANSIVAVSEFVKKISIKAYNITSKVEVIYNFYDSSKFFNTKGKNRDSGLILFVGKFHERKGVFEMFDRLEELLRTNDQFRFQYIGSYDEEFKNRLFDRLPDVISRRIEFVGRVPHEELFKYFQKATFTLVPSRTEAFGLIAVEAMACGSIVIMNQGHVGKELIENDKNGYIIDFNRPYSLLKLLNQVFTDTEKLQQMSKAAVVKAKPFKLDYIIQENLSFYKNVMRK